MVGVGRGLNRCPSGGGMDKGAGAAMICGLLDVACSAAGRRLLQDCPVFITRRPPLRGRLVCAWGRGRSPMVIGRRGHRPSHPKVEIEPRMLHHPCVVQIWFRFYGLKDPIGPYPAASNPDSILHAFLAYQHKHPMPNLMVAVAGCTDVRDADWFSKSDPYCVLQACSLGVLTWSQPLPRVSDLRRPTSRHFLLTHPLTGEGHQE